MTWSQNLLRTYDACASAVGSSDGGQDSMLLPIGHLLTGLDAIIHLKNDGSFHRAEEVKSSSKNKIQICIPCTDESESRSGQKSSDFPHPLFDQIKYLSSQKYINNLERWKNYLGSSRKYPLACRAITAVYNYVIEGTISEDLRSSNVTVKDDLFIAFCVDLDNSSEKELWLMPELWDAWSDFYSNEDIERREKKDTCYVTGISNSTYSEKHPKSINRVSGNAKLISGNDKTNFTFRGRFETPSQAVTVSYEASQKVHQALRWLLSKTSCYRCDSQAIIAWAIDDSPDTIDFYDDSYGIYDAVVQTASERKIMAETTIFVDYAIMLGESLRGYANVDDLITHKRRIAIMATDSATTGRMSITYYRELSEDEYIECIDRWHNTCKWYQPYGKKAGKNERSGYFIGAPSVGRITIAVLGKRRSLNDTSYDKLVKNLREQLIHCIFGGDRIPVSVVTSALGRVTNPFAFEDPNSKSAHGRWRDWEYALGATCALIKRYYHDYKKEEFAVGLETERQDRDYLYGRLLAVADRIENHARYVQGRAKEDVRATNAIRYMATFSQRPFRTWNMLMSQQLNPYIQQLNGAGWYLDLIGEITQLFEAEEFENDAPLDGRYLLGFFAQRQEIYMKSNITKSENGGEDNELE